MKPGAHPADILDALGITDPSELDLEAIAYCCGATVLYERLEGCEAQILGSGDRAIITVRGDVSLPRKRFSIAHELGHWMRDRGKVGFACTERSFLAEWAKEGRMNPERRANRFAADLLLPKAFFKPEAAGLEMTLANASNLATRYQTSLTATAIRLVELGSFPAMLVCTEEGRRKWFVRGPDVPDFVWPVEEIGGDSVAYELLDQGSATPPGSIEVAADNWIDRGDAYRYAISEDSRRSGAFVLTLLWWKDQRQLIDLVG